MTKDYLVLSISFRLESEHDPLIYIITSNLCTKFHSKVKPVIIVNPDKEVQFVTLLIHLILCTYWAKRVRFIFD